jgi:ADP-L-glycero-D-manno-heptose 6-epimerase
MRVVVTGAAGFIGSNLVHALNRMGIDDVVAVDDLTDGTKFLNLRGTRLADYFDRDEFHDLFAKGTLGHFDVVFHQGACSDTMQHDGRGMMRTNYRFSKDILDVCARRGTRLIYASSAAVYGSGPVFVEAQENERPLNVYGYSKLVFDDVVRARLFQSAYQIVGLRYFNVYGPREQHKARMASVAFHNFNEFQAGNSVQLFGEYGGYGPGLHQRDFVSVDDVVSVNLWFLMHPQCNGVFNVGTGRAQPFNDVAMAVVNSCRRSHGLPELQLEQMVAEGLVKYKPIPDALIGKYQCHTQADLNALRRIGCDIDFADVATGVQRYVDWLTSST